MFRIMGIAITTMTLARPVQAQVMRQLEPGENFAAADQNTTLSGLALNARTSCPRSGPLDLEASGGSGGRIVFLYATRQGSFPIPHNQPCAGTVLDLGGTLFIAGSASGNPAVLHFNYVPGPACGRLFLQAIDLGTCTTSNVVRFQ